ncbi:MAG: hypothetical protein BWY06_02889 [Candidatus Latescibacteria bacterium ADurb.Bin168]|nr:MAG: hypothetical protein BWY06_02889 [Candidatus Latescibacteria bacterium ADurb.Bin168]
MAFAHRRPRLAVPNADFAFVNQRVAAFQRNVRPLHRPNAGQRYLMELGVALPICFRNHRQSHNNRLGSTLASDFCRGGRHYAPEIKEIQ